MLSVYSHYTVKGLFGIKIHNKAELAIGSGNIASFGGRKFI